MGNNLRGEALPDENSQSGAFDENIMVNQGTSDWPQPQLTFHQVHGSNIELQRSGRIAKRKESFCKGLAFSARPIQVDEQVCIRFSEVVTNWSGVLRFGVTNVNPETFRPADLPKFACPDLTSKDGYWAKALPERYSVEGSILHFYVTSEGELYYGINGVLKGQFLNGINVSLPIWVIVDIYGNSSSLEFVDPNDVRIRSSAGRAGGRSHRTASINNSSTVRSHGVGTGSRGTIPPSSTHTYPPSKYHAGVSFTSLTFHTVKGRNILFSSDYTVAERCASEYACGYVFTNRPLAFSEKIVIQILDVESAYNGSLAFGLTCCDPITLCTAMLPDNSDDLLERPEYWVSIKDVGAVPPPKATDELSFWLTAAGEVYFAKNNMTARVIMHVDPNVSLWAFFDVYGSTQRIRLLGTTTVGGNSNGQHQQQSHHQSSTCQQPQQRVPPLPATNSRTGSSSSSRLLLDMTSPAVENLVIPPRVPPRAGSVEGSSNAAPAVGTPASLHALRTTSSVVDDVTAASNPQHPPQSILAGLTRRTHSETGARFGGDNFSGLGLDDVRHRVDTRPLPPQRPTSSTIANSDSGAFLFRSLQETSPPPPPARARLFNPPITPQAATITPRASITPVSGATTRSSIATAFGGVENSQHQQHTVPSSHVRPTPLPTVHPTLAIRLAGPSTMPPGLPTVPPMLPTVPPTVRQFPSVEDRSGGSVKPGKASFLDEDDRDECKICMMNKVNCVIYKCGHMSTCYECATRTWGMNGECPICRKTIEDVIKIYKS